MLLRIRELREDRDLKQDPLAKYLNVHQTTYSDYELGKLNVPVPILIALARYYNTSIDYLLSETDEPARYPKAKRNKIK